MPYSVSHEIQHEMRNPQYLLGVSSTGYGFESLHRHQKQYFRKGQYLLAFFLYPQYLLGFVGFLQVPYTLRMYT